MKLFAALTALAALIIVVVSGARPLRRGSRRDRPRPSISSPCRCPDWTVLTLHPPRQLTCFLLQPPRLPHHHHQPPPPPPPQCWSPPASTPRAFLLSRVSSPGLNLKQNDPEGKSPPSFSHFWKYFWSWTVIRRLGLRRTPDTTRLGQHPHSVTPSLVRKATVISSGEWTGQSVYFYL